MAQVVTNVHETDSGKYEIQAETSVNVAIAGSADPGGSRVDGGSKLKKKEPKTGKKQKKQQQQKSKAPQLPDGIKRLQFLNQATALLNDGILGNGDMTNKLNMYYGEVGLMVRDKYMLKTEPKRKRLQCKRCQQMFSQRQGTVHRQIEEVNLKIATHRLITTCMLCGYACPRLLRNKPNNHEKSTNFYAVTSGSSMTQPTEDDK